MAIDKSGSTARVTHVADSETPINFTLRSRVDCGDDNILDNGIVNLIDVRRGDIVHLLVVEIVTAEGGVLTIDFGDGDDDDRFFDGINANVTAGTRYIAWPQFEYVTADTIDMVVRDAADTAVIELQASIIHIPIVTAE